MGLQNELKNRKKYQIISPLDIQHFVLDVPITKDKYQYNVVKFALRSLYPGNEETTSIDYTKIKKTIIGLACNTQKINELKKENTFLVSPVFIAANLQKEGLVVSLSEDWILIQLIKNGEIKDIRIYSSHDVEIFENELKTLCDENNLDNRSLILFRNYSTYYENLIKQFNFSLIIREKDIPISILKTSVIFTEKKKNKYLIPIIVLIVSLFVLVSVDISIYKKSVDKKKQVIELKNKYEVEKKKKLSEVKEEEPLVVLDQKYGLLTLLSTIADADSSMRIINLSINGQDIKMEAECSNAIYILENLSNSNIFENVTLHQSIPKEGGVEHSIFSMKVCK